MFVNDRLKDSVIEYQYVHSISHNFEYNVKNGESVPWILVAAYENYL